MLLKTSELPSDFKSKSKAKISAVETTDEITIDCSVADKLSGTLSIMEIT